MEEYQQHEEFDMDSDYEGGQWIGIDSFYTEKKRKRRQTKEELLYGYESEQSDEDESRRGKRPLKSTVHDQVVGFFSSGVVRSTEGNPEDIQSAEHSGAGLRDRYGLGEKQCGTGLGYPGFSVSSGIGFRLAKDPQLLDDYDGDGGVVLPTSFGKRVKQAVEESLKEKKRREKEAAAARPAMTPGTPSVGDFERHTKGIGAQLLASMGYQEGQGLGRNKQGISKPIEVKRPKGMGLGYNDYAEHKLIPDAKPAEEAPEKAKEEAMDVKLWQKSHAAARGKRKFKTADEVLQEAAEKPAGAPRQTILDMRGPQARLVTNLEHLNVVDEAAAGDLVPMPELQHNLRLLVDLAEADIYFIDGKLRHETDTKAILGQEQRHLQKKVEVGQRQVAQGARVLQKVSRFQSTDPQLSLGDLARTYSKLRSRFREEYVMYNLAAAALAQVMPRLTSLLAEWRPLEEPDRGLHYFSVWRPLLESDAQRNAIVQVVSLYASEDSYPRLLLAVVLPKLARTITNSWEPRDPEPPLRFLELWADLLPTTIQRHILDTLIMPKLSRAVQLWEPREDHAPLHAWLHPWLEMLGPQLEDLYPPIRFKRATALQAWHPSDAPALALLSPWHKAPPCPSIPVPCHAATEPSMRQLVENYAQEHGMEFLPKGARRDEGLQVYGFGGVSCVIDASGGIVRAHIGGDWVPTCLQDLLNEARKRQRF